MFGICVKESEEFKVRDKSLSDHQLVFSLGKKKMSLNPIYPVPQSLEVIFIP